MKIYDFKPGDKVRVLRNRFSGHAAGTTGIIKGECHGMSERCWIIIPDNTLNTYPYYNGESELELLIASEGTFIVGAGGSSRIGTMEEIGLLKDNKITMKEKFITMFLKEPEKSFRKAGVTNGDGFLTSDGQALFLSYILSKNGDAFKKDVVDGLLAEEEKKNK